MKGLLMLTALSACIACSGEGPTSPFTALTTSREVVLAGGDHHAAAGKCVPDEKASKLLLTGNWVVASDPACAAGETAITHA
jgi:hypothetical protein